MDKGPALYVFYWLIDTAMPQAAFAQQMKQLPAAMHQDILKYRLHADRVRTLAGRLLLKEAIRQAGLPQHLMETLAYTGYKRPYIKADIDFNVTHSGRCVACVAGRNMKVGIDVEEHKPIAPDDITTVLRADELQQMQQQQATPADILRFWTRKEAIVKASGEGLYMQPQSIYFKDDLTAVAGHTTWYLHELDFHPGYTAFCTSNVPNAVLKVERVEGVEG
jgi:4'-phosphopantetheinyl transferase